jgi:hypothetical protein
LIFTNQTKKQTKTDKYMNESYEQVFLDIISLSLSHFGQKLQLSFFLSFYFNQFFQVDSFITSSFLVTAAAGASSLFFILYFFILFLSNFLF